jgi:hypothetical protein|tara:strand:+ start:1034 stop:1228 length:195 start_codon:yes stop_codon:yes gene_type:complete
MAKSRPCLSVGKLSRQKSKLLMRSGGELDEMILGNIEKFPKGGAKKKLGGGTHNTYSGKSKKRK